MFIHENHAHNKSLPRFAGWWGHNKEVRFQMEPGFDPIPGAALALVLESGERIEIKVKEARRPKETGQQGLKVAFIDGELEILRLQPAGKGLMDASAFLRGLRQPVKGWLPLG